MLWGGFKVFSFFGFFRKSQFFGSTFWVFIEILWLIGDLSRISSLRGRRLRTKFPASYEQFENGKRSMLNYFLTDGGDKWPLLKDLAIRVFSLISSSACVERANSTMGFIHSKL